MMTTLMDIKVDYSRAFRCWRSNNLRLCLQVCNRLTSSFSSINPNEYPMREYVHLKQLIWSLKIKCLAEDCYVNESLLLNADDIESEDQVRTFTTTSTNKRPGLSRQNATSSITITGHQQSRRSGTGAIVDQRKTAIVTGRMPSASSRQSGGRASSSYRPLTTSLTASQTAFSQSTRPLLRYASDPFLSKSIYEYLYNVQKVTNKCPDYRQCLEYLNIVQQSSHERDWGNFSADCGVGGRKDSQLVVLLGEDQNDKNLEHMDVFWLLALGICYFNLRMNKLALEYFDTAKRANLKHMDAYLWLIKIYLRQGEPIKVLMACDEGLQNCKNAILFNWKARVQSLLNDSYAAHLSLRDSLNFYPTNIEALANVGHFSFYGDKLEQALQCFERINQLSMNTNGSICFSGDTLDASNHSSSELLNNLALCNFFCGNLTRVVPLFQQAFLSSPNKNVTSNIWYNLSFLPLNLGFRNLAIACLHLALKNDSQNEEAINNIGVLKYSSMINDPLHYKNRQELWSSAHIGASSRQTFELKNEDHNHRRQQVLFDEAETYFSTPGAMTLDCQENGEQEGMLGQPEMLFNMAMLKHKRGQLLSSVKYCQHYLEFDQNNYMIQNIMREIKQLVSHDA